VTSFLFLHSAAAVALAIFLGLTGTILSIVAVCKAVALGQRPMNQIVRDAEDRRQQNRRLEDRP
jgi:hypothetical protein